MVVQAIDLYHGLLESYKKFKLDEKEVMVIFMIDHLLQEGETFITADQLSLKMKLDEKEIDSILANLISKNLLDFKTKGKKTFTTLEPLKDRLFKEFEYQHNKEMEERENKELTDTLNYIYSTYEKLLNKSLSPVETSKIKEWLIYGYNKENIVDALKDTLNQNKKTLRAVEKILVSYQIREDIDSDGQTSISSNWDKNLEETIRIAKTPWLDDDNE